MLLKIEAIQIDNPKNIVKEYLLSVSGSTSDSKSARVGSNPTGDARHMRV